MKNVVRTAIVSAAVLLCCVRFPLGAAAQELSAEAKDKEVAAARAKRNALQFENNARTIVFYDRAGNRTGALGERALYGETIMSPDRSRVAVVKNDLANESADIFILDIATGASTRLTTSARTEFVMINNNGSCTPRRMNKGRTTLSSAATGRLQIKSAVPQPVLPLQYNQAIAGSSTSVGPTCATPSMNASAVRKPGCGMPQSQRPTPASSACIRAVATTPNATLRTA